MLRMADQVERALWDTLFLGKDEKVKEVSNERSPKQE